VLHRGTPGWVVWRLTHASQLNSIYVYLYTFLSTAAYRSVKSEKYIYYLDLKDYKNYR